MIYIFPYYFYLVHVMYYLYLTKINLFISIPYPNQVYDKEKNISQWWFCVCCTMSCSEIFLSQDGVFQHSMYQKNFLRSQSWWRPLVNTSLISQFQENVNSFSFLANTLILLPWLLNWLQSIYKLKQGLWSTTISLFYI